MAVWTVFEAEDGEADALSRGDGVVFVQEAFAWRALFFAPLVLLANRLWLTLLAYGVIEVALLVAFVRLELGGWFVAVLLVPHLFVALELAGLRRWKLARRGFEEAGVVVADGEEAAERRYFEARSGIKAAPGPVLGLFPEVAGR